VKGKRSERGEEITTKIKLKLMTFEVDDFLTTRVRGESEYE
jgi:hypothetical protein